MRRRICLGIMAAVMILCLFGSVVSAHAEELTGQTETQSLSGTLPVTAPKLTGWQKSGGYKFYYTKKGKMVTGWRTIGKKIYYFRTEAEGDAPAGSMVTGWQTINGKKFYFGKSSGYLRTSGWIKISKKYYYLRKTGKAGTIGAAYNSGLQKISGKYYYFNSTGNVATGWKTIDGKRYYFRKGTKLGTRGSAVTGWKKIGSYTYYFNTKGVMQTNKWISKKYYVDASGHKLVKAVTPDRYYINSSGERSTVARGWKKIGSKYYYFNSNHRYVTGWKTISGKRYYFNSSGVRQKGWLTLDGAKYYLKKGVMQTGLVTIGGKKYYFAQDGKLYVNTTVDGYTIGADGVVTSTGAKILIIAGHGQGDVGAIGKYSKTTYYEYKLTRAFSTLIQSKLASAANLTVTMYDQNYDCYQQNAKALTGLSFTGSGAKKTKVAAAVKSSSTVPDFTQYDYVLEVHFNATAESSKDSKGDGVQKGTGMYINSYKAKKLSNYTIDRNIIAAIAKQTGFKVWGGGAGIFASEGLLNAKTCQELGVSYGLLETAFIDDKDDITFYNKNKDAMAQAVASAIIAYFS